VKETPASAIRRILREISRTDHPLHVIALRHLGYAYKKDHQWDDALAVFAELTAISPSSLHLGQPAQLLSISRRFKQAAAAATGLRIES
jgi:hypothetical protein